MPELNFESEELNKICVEIGSLRLDLIGVMDDARLNACSIKSNLEDSSQLRPDLERILEMIDTLGKKIKDNLEKTKTFLEGQMQQYEIDTDEAAKKIDEAIDYIENFVNQIYISNA